MPIETANKNSKRKNPERATPEEETSINQHIEYEQRRNNRLKDDTIDYAQQDNAILNEANSKDINEDQEHYDDVVERTFYLTRKFLKACLQRSKTKKEVINRYGISPDRGKSKLRKKCQKQRGKTAPAYTDQTTNIHDEEPHGKREDNLNTDLSVSKNVCAEAKIQGGQLIDELTEDMITSQGEQHILQSEKNSGVVLTKSKLNNEEENAQTYNSSPDDFIVATHGEKQKLQSDDDAAEQSHSHMELTDSNLNNEEDRTQPHLKDTFDYDGTSTIKRGRSRQQTWKETER
ncbi:hypothetical protein H5410_021087 [Solanum commersonii]|uniref:Uncharacterized protein n=1 Tax=Solanum commersonii TaxID=4109 RepID=A0A9J5ZG53_SOLCO|nr:hypothetical protein H5410_021087 [Solanum commersonii]